MHEIKRSDATIQTATSPTNPYIPIRIKPINLLTDIHLNPLGNIGAYISQVVTAEAPVHVDVVIRRLLELYKITRAGKRIKDTVSSAIQQGISAKLFEMKGEFLYTTNQESFPHRDRSTLDATERKMQYVAAEESSSALLEIAEHAIDIELGELISDALALLGFKRATTSASDRVADSVKNLLHIKKLAVIDNKYRRAE